MAGGDPGGGSRVLARLIDQFGEALVYDFRHYLHLDLADFVREGGLPPRLALAYIRQLPAESAFSAAQQGGPQFRGWGVTEYWLAALFDAIRENTYAFVSANSKRKPSLPTPAPRPKREEKKRPNLFRVMAAQHIAAARKAKEGSNGGTQG